MILFKKDEHKYLSANDFIHESIMELKIAKNMKKIQINIYQPNTSENTSTFHITNKCLKCTGKNINILHFVEFQSNEDLLTSLLEKLLHC